MDKLSKLLVVMAVAIVAGVFLIVIPIVWERNNRAEARASEIGCKDLGTARDMSSVRFFDCNGVVKLEIVK